MPVITCIDDLRALHRRRAPRMFFDYCESGSWSEQTFRENTTDFDRLRPAAYCPTCDQTVRAMQVFKKAERWGRYRAQYNYRCPHTACRNQIVEPGWLPASSAIDWSIAGERIGDRARPLAPKTLARIERTEMPTLSFFLR